MNSFNSLLNDALKAIEKIKSGSDVKRTISDFWASFREEVVVVVQSQDPQQIQQFFQDKFKDIQKSAKECFSNIWDEWLEQSDTDLSDLVQAVYELSAELDDASFMMLIDTLLEKKQDFAELIRSATTFCLRKPEEAKQRLAHLWEPLLISAFKSLTPEKLTQSIISVITDQDGELSRKISVQDLNILPEELDTPALKRVFASPDYQLPAGVVFTGLGLQGLLQRANIPQGLSFLSIAKKSVEDLFNPLKDAINELNLKHPSEIDGKFLMQVFSGLIEEAEQNEDVEWALLEMARFTPVGIFLVISAVMHGVLHHTLPWWNLLFNEIESDPSLKVKRLPSPKKGGPKYLIFSDLHRDAQSDRRDLFEFGSIDHFALNQTLYCELLDYAIEKGFTVLEAGDCDELWFWRDFSRRPRAKLQEIMKTHKPVYDRLVRLHKEGRYFRLYGNHDCYIRNPEVFELFQNLFDEGKGPDDPPYDMYDFAIIEDVKTMDDSILNFGLDSEPYQSTAPMIIAHGHQWDFWNCDQNNLIGKLIVSTVVTPLDLLDDPFLDLGGIAWEGSPVFKFSEKFSKTLILSSFPTYNPSRKFAHKIQHLDEADRRLMDDIMYSESLAALAGATISVKKQPDSTETRRDNLCCLGHTHYPQSQPNFSLKSLLPFTTPMFDFIASKISDVTWGLFKPDLSNIKSKYFNSGTAGWMEGVIWAIQIDETGQARLVYWTRDTRPDRPQMMDWELPFMDDECRKKLEEKKLPLFKMLEDLTRLIDPSIEAAFTGVTNAIKMSFQKIALSFEHLLDFADQIPDTDKTLDPSQPLDDPLGPMFLALRGAKSPRTFTLRVPLPSSIHSSLVDIEKFIDGLSGNHSVERTRLASAWLLASSSISLLSGSKEKFKGLSEALPELNSSLKSVLGLVLQLPNENNHHSPIKSRVSIERNNLVLRIRIEPEKFQPVSKQSSREAGGGESKKKFFQQLCILWRKICRLVGVHVGEERLIEA